MKKVLVVEDEVKIARLVRDYLRQAGFAVVEAGDGQAALALARQERPDMIVLDLGLPGMDGLDVTRRLRATSAVPIIMLTARSEESDRIVGLELGADDYVTKPFSPREVVARIKALLRRSRTAVPDPELTELRFADVEVDFKQFQARRAGKPVKLTAREFQVLRLFGSRPGEVITRDEFLDQVWGQDVYITNRSVDNQVWALRRKLEDDPEAPSHFVSVRSVGYRFVPEGEE